jgi:hypothetical protein
MFTIQTERIVDNDNTVAIGPRSWQIDKTRFRHMLAGTTVTVDEHLNGEVSIRFGPHVVARFTAAGEATKDEPERHGRGGPHCAGYRSCSQDEEGGSRRLNPKPDRSLIT